MSKGRLSSEEIRSLLQDSGATPPNGLIAMRIAADKVTCPPASGNQQTHSQDNALPGATASTEIAADTPALAEDLARNLGAALSETLRAKIPVALVRTERVPFGDFVARCKQPTFFTTVGDEGSDSRIAVDISLSILLTAINRMLGGSLRDAPLPARPLTQIEQTLSGRFVDRVSRELQVVLGGESTAVWKADPVAEYPDHAEVPSSTKTVMSIDFAVQMGSTCGLLRFAIPWSLLEQAARGDDAGATRIGESAGPDASVQLSAVIARWQLSPTELGDLQVGNVIEMDADVGAAIEVELNGNLRFYASPGALRGHRAVKIERVADPL